MNSGTGLGLVIACAAAAAAFSVGWLLLPSARAAPVVEGAPTAVASSQEVTEADAILEEVLALRGKLDAYAMQPGWTLLRYENHYVVAWNSPKPLPSRHERETWLRFNDSRQVYQAVSYAIAPELGRVLIYYDLDGQSVSVWHGERYPQPPYTPKLQLYLEDTLRGLIGSGSYFEIASREAVLGGRPVWVVELKYAYSEEASRFAVGFDPPVRGVHEVLFLDPETGMIVRCEHAYVLDDGSVVPTGTLTFWEIRANVQPPDEVLEVLRQAGREEER